MSSWRGAKIKIQHRDSFTFYLHQMSLLWTGGWFLKREITVSIKVQGAVKDRPHCLYNRNIVTKIPVMAIWTRVFYVIDPPRGTLRQTANVGKRNVSENI
jgi:hypothetical protein